MSTIASDAVEICHTCHRKRCGGDACPGPHPPFPDDGCTFVTRLSECNVCGLLGMSALLCAHPAAKKDATS